MHIGFFPALGASSGGVHQYSLAFLSAVGPVRNGDQHTVFVLDAKEPAAIELRATGWAVRSVPTSPFRRLGRTVAHRVPQLRRLAGRDARRPGAPVDVDAVRPNPELGAWLRDCGVDLMVYPAPHVLSFETGVPFVTAVHDLQHRLQPRFPEVSANGEWERREYLFRHAIREATLVIADSDVGREDIDDLYGAGDKVRVLPFPPPPHAHVAENDIARVRSAYGLPERYGFYPAQFWPHKNHARIVRAVARARDAGCEVCVAFSGSHDGGIRERTYAELHGLVAELGVGHLVRFLGYVPSGDVPALYAAARALVMPTFFGPTNIPVLEAWQHRCAVVSSDVRGIRDQVGDAGLVVDPESVDALADALVRIWTDDALHSHVVARGAERVAAYTFDDFAARLLGILDEAKALVSDLHVVPAA